MKLLTRARDIEQINGAELVHENKLNDYPYEFSSDDPFDNFGLNLSGKYELLKITLCGDGSF
jgi:hypothetical protein